MSDKPILTECLLQDGFTEWLTLDGLWHREDGPAIEWDDGEKEWYWLGKQIDCTTQEEFERYLKLKAFW